MTDSLKVLSTIVCLNLCMAAFSIDQQEKRGEGGRGRGGGERWRWRKKVLLQVCLCLFFARTTGMNVHPLIALYRVFGLMA